MLYALTDFSWHLNNATLQIMWTSQILAFCAEHQSFHKPNQHMNTHFYYTVFTKTYFSIQTLLFPNGRENIPEEKEV